MDEKLILDFCNKVEKCREVANKYALPNDIFEKIIEEIKNFKVITPIIGGFSTGKSSMINALLEKNILKTDITPETAIPTEIYYGNNLAKTYKRGNLVRSMNIEEFKKFELDGEKIDLVQIEVQDEFFKSIPYIKLVDMPGFDSGIEMHNRAIDNYLPNSLAYIITFSADEAVIKESIVNFLSELKLHDIPIYIVITKCDKVTDYNLGKVIEYIRENIIKYLDKTDIKVFTVKSKRNKDVDGLKEILVELQNNAEKIFKKDFTHKIKELTYLIQEYLESRIKNINLSDSELFQKEEELKEKVKNNIEKINKLKEKFNEQINKCVENIKNDILVNLRGASSMLQSMLLNNMDIQEKINQIVRNSVIVSMKKYFEPKIQKYMKDIANVIKVDVNFDNNLSLNEVAVATDNMVKDIAIKSIPVIISAIGGVLAGPIGAVIGGALAVFIDTLFKSKHENDKKNIAREKVENEIIPQVISNASQCIEAEILSYVDVINEDIANKVYEEQNVIKKSIQDIKIKRQEEEKLKKLQLEELNNDLNIIRGIVNGI
ncbi:MAG: dynamin family protein [Clostridium sp.]|nr:dynamin family protein [Clostridium sp.]